MKLSVQSVQIEEKTSNRTGKPYYLQTIRAELNGEIRNLKVFIQDKNKPYQPGNYRLGEKSFQVDQYSALKIGFIDLEPLVAGATAAAAGK